MNNTKDILLYSCVFIVTIIIMLLIKYGIEYYNNTNMSPMILTASKNAKKVC